MSAQAQADRGGAAAGGDQPRVGAGEVDPPRAPVDAAPVVGAPAAGGLPGRAVRPARRRPVSSHPEQFPTEEAQERRARAAVRHHRAARDVGEHHATSSCSPRRTGRDPASRTDGNPPPILDPFAGGGSIPLEAQRLGLEAHASDLNPVAVLINKALIEIPPKFAGQPPVFPGAGRARARRLDRRRRARRGRPPLRRSGCATRPRSASATCTRRRRCPTGSRPPSSPGSGPAPSPAPTPPAGSRCRWCASCWLGKKKGKEAYVVPPSSATRAQLASRRFEIGHDKAPAAADRRHGRAAGCAASCADGGAH